MTQKKISNKVLCIVAGGSGGHITPAITLGKKWEEKNTKSSILFFSNNNRLEKNILSKDFFKKNRDLKLCKLSNFPGKKLWLYPIFLSQLIITFVKSIFFLYKKKPAKIISTGGHLAIPVCLAGAVLKIPIELYELNVMPGKATKFLAPIAKNIFVTFEKSKFFFNGAKLEPYPLRFSKLDKIKTEKIFKNNKKTIFILGGSQGSIFLNNLLKKFIQKQSFKNFNIIHQTGSIDKTNWEAFYKKNRVNAFYFSYHKDIKNLYLASDLVISRGGAGALFELEFFEKKSIIIPIKNHASDHQIENSIQMVKRNQSLFTLLDQNSVDKNFDIFESAVKASLDTPDFAPSSHKATKGYAGHSGRTGAK